MTISAWAGRDAEQAAPTRAYGAIATPDRDLDRTISHLLSTAVTNAGHLDVHAAAAQAAGDPALLSHHLRHAAAHVRSVSSHLVKLRAAVARRLPPVARELDSLDRAVPGGRGALGDVPRAALDMSIAHDLASAQAAAAHTARHLSEAQLAHAAGNKVSVTFNIEHAVHHISEVAHYLSELDADLTRRLPAVGRETGRLHQAATPDGKAPVPERSRGRDADYDAARDRGPWPA